MIDRPAPSTKLSSVIENMDPPAEAVLNQSFISEHTEFENFGSMLEENDWLTESGDIDYQITIDDVDGVVSQTSEFNNWFEMVKTALDELWKDKERNRRQFKRYSCNLNVEFQTGMKEKSGTVLDISKKGLQLETEADLPSTGILEIELP
ncbi:MAG: PilZ domain-containing protein, partial [bacterium]